MDDLASQEQSKYDRIWNSFPEYRLETPADCLTPVFLLHFQREMKKGQTVIDFGCGPGRSAVPLLDFGLKVHLVDISESSLDPEIFLLQMQSKIAFTQSPLWSLPPQLKPADWGICFDVMEHIPESKVDDVFKAMALRIKKGALFSIFLQPDQFGQTIGESLHLTIRPGDWWRSKLNHHFSIDKVLLENEKKIVLAIFPILQVVSV